MHYDKKKIIRNLPVYHIGDTGTHPSARILSPLHGPLLTAGALTYNCPLNPEGPSYYIIREQLFLFQQIGTWQAQKILWCCLFSQ